MKSLSHLLCIDENLIELLQVETPDAISLAKVLEQRTLCLADISKHADSLNPEAWRLAIERTRFILAQLQRHRDNSAMQTQRFIKGRKSIQTYNTYNI